MQNANGELLKDAAILHWSSNANVNELLMSLIAQKGNVVTQLHCNDCGLLGFDINPL